MWKQAAVSIGRERSLPSLVTVRDFDMERLSCQTKCIWCRFTSLACAGLLDTKVNRREFLLTNMRTNVFVCVCVCVCFKVSMCCALQKR